MNKEKIIFLVSGSIIVIGLLFLNYKKVLGSELVVVIITSLTALFGIFYTQHTNQLEITKRNKIETYEKYGESIVRYLFRNDKDKNEEGFINYQVSRFKFCLWASDETARVLLKIAPQNKYNTSDPVSQLIYAMRCDINRESGLSINEMAGIDPAQWTATLGRGGER